MLTSGNTRDFTVSVIKVMARYPTSELIWINCDKWNFPWINQRNNSLKCCSRKNSLHFPGCDLVNYVPDQLLLLLFKTNTEVLFVDFCLISCNLHTYIKLVKMKSRYHKVASTCPSRLEAPAGFFILLIKGIFYLHVLWPFDKKLIS